MEDHSPLKVKMTRRQVLIAGTTSAAATALPAATTLALEATAPLPPRAAEVSKVALNVNGTRHALQLDTRTTLLDALREHLRLTGTKKGCDHGQCGACTVIVEGRRINACLTLAVMHDGDRITTIEGIGTPRAAASDAGGLRQARRLPVRLLHAGTDLLRRRRAGRDQGRHSQPRHAGPHRATATVAQRKSANA